MRLAEDADANAIASPSATRIAPSSQTTARHAGPTRRSVARDDRVLYGREMPRDARTGG
jgi:hypothetical protein